MREIVQKSEQQTNDLNATIDKVCEKGSDKAQAFHKMAEMHQENTKLEARLRAAQLELGHTSRPYSQDEGTYGLSKEARVAMTTKSESPLAKQIVVCCSTSNPNSIGSQASPALEAIRAEKVIVSALLYLIEGGLRIRHTE